MPTDKRHALALQVVKQEEKMEELGGSTEPNLPMGGANRLVSANPLALAVRIKTRIDIKAYGDRAELFDDPDNGSLDLFPPSQATFHPKSGLFIRPIPYRHCRELIYLFWIDRCQ